MAAPIVIVFGATGRVGSFAARTAQSLGAKVFLASRDTDKPIPGLSAEAEQAGGYQRIAADLTQPGSVAEAVKTSGATRAFFYSAHGAVDFMKSSIVALKSAGIEWVVFLSSYTVTGEPSAVPSHEITPYVHARVEVNLDEIFGASNYMAVRPGSFATNTLWFKSQIQKGAVPMLAPNVMYDWVAPNDIGAVCGTFLTNGKRPYTANHAYVLGPGLISRKEAVATIAQHLDMEVEFQDSSEEMEFNKLTAVGIPATAATYIVNKLQDQSRGDCSVFSQEAIEEGPKTIQVLAGRQAMGFSDWIEQNKNLFLD